MVLTIGGKKRLVLPVWAVAVSPGSVQACEKLSQVDFSVVSSQPFAKCK